MVQTDRHPLPNKDSRNSCKKYPLQLGGRVAGETITLDCKCMAFLASVKEARQQVSKLIMGSHVHDL